MVGAAQAGDVDLPLGHAQVAERAVARGQPQARGVEGRRAVDRTHRRQRAQVVHVEPAVVDGAAELVQLGGVRAGVRDGHAGAQLGPVGAAGADVLHHPRAGVAAQTDRPVLAEVVQVQPLDREVALDLRGVAESGRGGRGGDHRPAVSGLRPLALRAVRRLGLLALRRRGAEVDAQLL